MSCEKGQYPNKRHLPDWAINLGLGLTARLDEILGPKAKERKLSYPLTLSAAATLGLLASPAVVQIQEIFSQEEGPGKPQEYNQAGSPTAYEYAKSLGLSEVISQQFNSVPFDPNSKAFIDEINANLKQYSDLFEKRPDIIPRFIVNGVVPAENVAKFKDVDQDGIDNQTEIEQGTSPWNPFEKDPKNLSLKYVILLDGKCRTDASSTTCSSYRADNVDAYLSYKKGLNKPLQFDEKRLLLLNQHDFSALINIYRFWSPLKPERGILKGDPAKIPQLEGKFRDLIQRAGLVDKYNSLEDFVSAWKSGYLDISDDLLSAYGPVVIDADPRKITRLQFTEMVKNLPTDENDIIYFFYSGDGDGWERGGELFVGFNNGTESLDNKQLNELISQKKFGRFFLFLYSPKSRGVADNLNDPTQGDYDVQNTIAIPSRNLDGSGCGYLSLHGTYALEKNPYLSTNQWLERVRAIRGCAIEPYRVVYGDYDWLEDFIMFPEWRPPPVEIHLPTLYKNSPGAW